MVGFDANSRTCSSRPVTSAGSLTTPWTLRLHSLAMDWGTAGLPWMAGLGGGCQRAKNLLLGNKTKVWLGLHHSSADGYYQDIDMVFQFHGTLRHSDPNVEAIIIWWAFTANIHCLVPACPYLGLIYRQSCRPYASILSSASPNWMWIHSSDCRASFMTYHLSSSLSQCPKWCWTSYDQVLQCRCCRISAPGVPRQ